MMDPFGYWSAKWAAVQVGIQGTQDCGNRMADKQIRVQPIRIHGA
jgi:hypothetical protein